MFLIDRKLLKFLAVGVVNTIIGCGLMFFLYNCLGFSYWISSACNYAAGGLSSYFLNKYFTFQNNEKNAKQIALFIINLALCYFLAYFAARKAVLFLLSASSPKMAGNISLACGMCLYVALNYIGQRLIVFSERKVKDDD